MSGPSADRVPEQMSPGLPWSPASYLPVPRRAKPFGRFALGSVVAPFMPAWVSRYTCGLSVSSLPSVWSAEALGPLGDRARWEVVRLLGVLTLERFN